MMQADDRFEDLMDYLTNRMPPDKRQAFEVELTTNQTLREALETERQLHEGLLAQAIRDQLTQIYGQLMTEGVIHEPELIRPLPVWRSYSLYAIIAASVVLVGGLTLYLFEPKAKPTEPVAIASKPKLPVSIGPKPIIIKAPQKEPNLVPNKRTVIPPKVSPQPKPPADLLAYNTFWELTKTLPIEDQLTPKETATRSERTEADELADGWLLLHQGTPAEAIMALKPLAESSSTTEWPQWAQWYLAGAYLRAHQVDQAQRVLTNISNNPAHPCQGVAKKLLQKIN